MPSLHSSGLNRMKNRFPVLELDVRLVSLYVDVHQMGWDLDYAQESWKQVLLRVCVFGMSHCGARAALHSSLQSIDTVTDLCALHWPAVDEYVLPTFGCCSFMGTGDEKTYMAAIALMLTEKKAHTFSKEGCRGYC